MTREEAIKMLGSLFLVAEVLKVDKEKRIEIKEALNMAIQALQEPEIVRSERESGVWTTEKYDMNMRCSNCNALIWYSGRNAYNYCPNCGADMRGEEE